MRTLGAALLLISSLAVWCAAVAGEHASAGLYDPQIYTLANGLRVVLQPRHHARTVAFRLAVDVGAWDFPCGEQELPHFVEHMVFTGTSAHDEQALEALVARHGGGWNANPTSAIRPAHRRFSGWGPDVTD